jgi:hypothetical protein
MVHNAKRLYSTQSIDTVKNYSFYLKLFSIQRVLHETQEGACICVSRQCYLCYDCLYNNLYLQLHHDHIYGLTMYLKETSR